MDSLPACSSDNFHNLSGLHNGAAPLVHGQNVFPQNGHDIHVQQVLQSAQVREVHAVGYVPRNWTLASNI